MKELKPGIFQLLPVNNKSEYANININTGMIVYCKRVSNLLPSSSKISFIEFEKLLTRDITIFAGKQYIKFRKEHPEIYNSMITRLNNLELKFEY